MPRLSSFFCFSALSSLSFLPSRCLKLQWQFFSLSKKIFPVCRWLPAFIPCVPCFLRSWPRGPTRGLGVGSLPQVWDGGGRGVSSRVRGQVFSIKTTSPVPSSCQCLVICKAPERCRELIVIRGALSAAQREHGVWYGSRPFPTDSNLVQDFFLIHESKMKIERKGRNFSWS